MSETYTVSSPYADDHESTEKQPNFEQPSQQRPFFINSSRHGSPKRIDFVLSYNSTNNNTNITRESSRLSHQTVKDTRRIYLHYLQETYGFEIEIHKSTHYENVVFCLLHLPFRQLELRANEMSINKPISEEYIRLVDNIVKGSRVNITGKISENDMQLIKERVMAAPNEEHDLLDKAEKEARNCSRFIPSTWFTVTHPLLQPQEPTFTTVYDKHHRSLFENIMIDEHINEDGFFTPAERSSVAYFLLRECPYTTDIELRKTSIEFGVERLLEQDVFTEAYPLHDCAISTNESDTFPKRGHMRKVLFDHWGQYGCFLKIQPLDHINNYFGTKIGLYFAWLGFYTRALLWATLFGFIPFVYGIVTLGKDPVVSDYCINTNTTDILMCPLCQTCSISYLKQACAGMQVSYIFDNRQSLYYAVIMSLWAALFLEFWKRRQFQLAYDWDLTDIDEDAEATRPRYRAKAAGKSGIDRSNPITLKKERYVPVSAKIPAKLGSVAVVLFWVMLVIIAVVGTIIYRLVVTSVLAGSDGFEKMTAGLGALAPYVSPSLIASVTASLVSVVTIVILNVIYQRVAMKLTDWECHRTDTKYETSLTVKMFWFQFVNYYSPLFYIAFFKDPLTGVPGNYFKFLGYRWQGCEAGGCTYELAIQMIVIMLVKQFLLNIVEIIIPWIKIKIKKMRNKKNGTENKTKSRWEQDYELERTTSLTLFDEYLEMIIQYGFVTLFVTAFPLAPLLALINNVIEIRLDAGKFLKYRQRAVAARAMNIGAWEHLLNILSNLAVVTNAFVIAITSETIPKMVYDWENPGDYDMTGYVQNSLSYYDTKCYNNAYNITAPDGSNATSCAYYGHRDLKDPNVPCEYKYNISHWKVLAAKFIFVIAIEHCVFAAVKLIDFIIPDRSKKLECEIKREQHLTRVIIRQAEVIQRLAGVTRNSMSRAKSKSQKPRPSSGRKT